MNYQKLQRNTLEQIITVLKYTKMNFDSGLSITDSYQKAVSKTSKEYSLTYQTIGDACRRRLFLSSIEEFYSLLKDWLMNQRIEKLQEILLKVTNPDDHKFIMNFFNSNLDLIEDHFIKEKESTTLFSVRFDKQSSDRINTIAHLRGITVVEFIKEVMMENLEKKFMDTLQKYINTLDANQKMKLFESIKKCDFPLESNQSEESRREYTFSIGNLFELSRINLTNKKPYKIIIDNKSFCVGSWAECDIVFVSYLIEKEFLISDQLPIHDSAENGKYFISSKPQKYIANEIGDQIKCVNDLFYVDTQYNANDHIRNYMATLKQIMKSDLSVRIDYVENEK